MRNAALRKEHRFKKQKGSAPPLQYSGGAYKNKEGVYAKYDNQTLFIVCFFGRRHKFFAPYAPIFIKKRDNIFSVFL